VSGSQAMAGLIGEKKPDSLWWNVPKSNPEGNHDETQPLFFTEPPS
jgi:hypothetical protein